MRKRRSIARTGTRVVHCPNASFRRRQGRDPRGQVPRTGRGRRDPRARLRRHGRQARHGRQMHLAATGPARGPRRVPGLHRASRCWRWRRSAAPARSSLEDEIGSAGARQAGGHRDPHGRSARRRIRAGPTRWTTSSSTGRPRPVDTVSSTARWCSTAGGSRASTRPRPTGRSTRRRPASRPARPAGVRDLADRRLTSPRICRPSRCWRLRACEAASGVQPARSGPRRRLGLDDTCRETSCWVRRGYPDSRQASTIRAFCATVVVVVGRAGGHDGLRGGEARRGAGGRTDGSGAASLAAGGRPSPWPSQPCGVTLHLW